MTDLNSGIGTPLIRRHIGRRFGALRTKAGLSPTLAGEKVELSRTTIDRLESGQSGVKFKDKDVRALLHLYDASDEDREELMALTAQTRESKTTSYLHSYELPRWFELYLTLEDTAEVIRQYEPELIPGLLQSRAYATEVTSVLPGILTDEVIERQVNLRIERQSLLTRPRAPRLEVVLNEVALIRALNTRDLAGEQLQQLLDNTQKANVDLRVLPLAVGIHGGMASSAGFSLLEFPADPRTGEPIEPPLAYFDSPTGALYLNAPQELKYYKVMWDDLLARALDTEASRKLIMTALEGLAR